MERKYKTIDQVLEKRNCGILVPFFVTEESLENLKSFKLYDDDMWIVSFPKSGTTWLQQIVKLIRSNGLQDETKITHSVPWLEAIARYPDVDVDKLPRPRAFKSHFPYDIFPCGDPSTHPCKYIYVARNLKDTAVSLYAQVKELVSPDLTWDGFFVDFMSWKYEFGDYFEHVIGWWKHRHDSNVLFLKYEDLKKDLRGNILKISSFVGANLSDDTVTRIADMATFQKMKENPTTNYKWNPKRKNFIRKGTVGDWKNYFSIEQSARIDALYLERFKSIGLEFDFE